MGTPLLLIGPNSSGFQRIVTNATATKSVNVNLLLIDLFGKAVQEADSVPIGPGGSFIQTFPDPSPLLCVVDLLGGLDASLERVVLVLSGFDFQPISLGLDEGLKCSSCDNLRTSGERLFRSRPRSCGNRCTVPRWQWDCGRPPATWW